MRTYKRENLTAKERELLAELLQDDLEEARKWAELYRYDDTGESGHIIANREAIEEKEPILQYLRGELENPREWYFVGYLTAYIRHKAQALSLDISERIEAYIEAEKNGDKEFIDKMNRKAGQLSKLRRILGGGYVQDPPEWDEDLEA